MKTTDIYGMHPSGELQKLFAEHPYQGQCPTKSKLIILGNDANYSSQISNHPFFSRILEYHKDGVSFWRDNEDGVHHPFLLKSYPLDRGDGGVPYHRNFAKLGLTKEYADHISFVELVNVPTTGSSSTDIPQFKRMLDKEHLISLENILISGQKKLVLINRKLINNFKYISKEFGCFSIFSKQLNQCRIGNSVVINASCVCYVGYHFSAAQIHGDVASMRQAIQEHCGF